MKIFAPDTINFTIDTTGVSQYPRNTLFPSGTTFPSGFNIEQISANGDVIIQPILCHEFREKDKWYLDVEVGLEHSSLIEQDVILMVETLEKGEQPFRVKNVEVGRVVRCEAHHIGFDTKLYAVELSYVLNQNCQSAIETLLLNTTPTGSPFTAYSNISTLSVHSVEDMSVYDGLKAIADHYNGFLEFDKWQIRIVSTIGQDRGVTLEYGKNIQQSEVFENWDNVVTKLKPIGNDGITLDPAWLTADVSYDKPYTKIIQFDTDSVENLDFVANMYLNQYKVPKVNYKVKAYIGNTVGFGDSVHVKAKQFEVDASVLAYEYNNLSQRMVEVEFGNYRRTVKTSIDMLKTDVARTTMMTVDAKGYIRSLIDDEVVTVGIDGMYNNINDALFYLAYKYPRFKQTAYPYSVSSAEILLLSGFVMNEQVLVQRMNLGFITISSESAEVTINRSALTTAMNTSEFDNEYPAFGGDENAVLPVINTLFTMNTTGLSERRHGIFVSKNSSAHIRPNKGVKNAGGYGIYAEGASNVNAESAIFTGALQNGISANNSSRINCQFADVTGAGWTGIIASDTSVINAQNCIADNCGTYGVVAQYGSTINARYMSAEYCGTAGFAVFWGSFINVKDTIGTKNITLNALRPHGSLFDADNLEVFRQPAIWSKKESDPDPTDPSVSEGDLLVTYHDELGFSSTNFPQEFGTGYVWGQVGTWPTDYPYYTSASSITNTVVRSIQCSSFKGDGYPHLIFDGNTDWNNGVLIPVQSAPATYIIEWKARIKINSFTLFGWAQGHEVKNSPKSFAFFVSNDGYTWLPIYDTIAFTDPYNTSVGANVTAQADFYKYLKMVFRSNQADNVTSLATLIAFRELRFNVIGYRNV